MNIVFVCLGNICRSPMAEYVAKDLFLKHGLKAQISSAGTSGYHDGEDMHIKTKHILQHHNIKADGFVSKKLTISMCENADLIVVMDKSNYKNVKQVFGFESKLKLLTDYSKELGYDEVPDPWYSGDFDETYKIVSTACFNLMNSLK